VVNSRGGDLSPESAGGQLEQPVIPAQFTTGLEFLPVPSQQKFEFLVELEIPHGQAKVHPGSKFLAEGQVVFLT